MRKRKNSPLPIEKLRSSQVLLIFILTIAFIICLLIFEIDSNNWLLLKVGSPLMGKILSFLLQRVGWEVGLLLAIVFSMVLPEDFSTVGHFMLPYNEASPKL